MSAPHIVALGGTLRPESATGRLLAATLEMAAARGARTTLLTGEAIAFPHYEPGNVEGNDAVGRYLEALRTADAVIVGSPGYHGTLSGLVKTALDYVEALSKDERPYLDGLPVGLIATAAGWQAAVSTLQALRTITHALRGWPTPMGLAINTAEPGDAVDKCNGPMDVMVGQIFTFLERRSGQGCPAFNAFVRLASQNGSMDEASAQDGIGNRRRATRTILAVDDSRTNLHVLAHRLGQLGYLVVLADRGSQALELISARGFDLVLLDRVMPEVPGLHVLHEIRGTRDTADLPVIMVTSHDEPGGAVEALQAGADDYLAAPYPFEELAARIERTLSRSDRMEELKRSNLALDARIAARAIELGEVRGELAMARVELERRQRA